MIGISRTLLYSLLTVALMIGGLPAWAGGTMSGHDAPALSTDSVNPGKSDCHSENASGASAADDSTHECCEADESCEHDDCHCLCLALTLVVPVRATATAWAAPASPAWASTAPSPTKITSTLLRPPRA